MDDQDDGRRARAPEPDDVVRICRALNDAGARYLLIGGFAVMAHGAGRFTKDIDLLVQDREQVPLPMIQFIGPFEWPLSFFEPQNRLRTS